jgi:hypothetical protein
MKRISQHLNNGRRRSSTAWRSRSCKRLLVHSAAISGMYWAVCRNRRQNTAKPRGRESLSTVPVRPQSTQHRVVVSSSFQRRDQRSASPFVYSTVLPAVLPVKLFTTTSLSSSVVFFELFLLKLFTPPWGFSLLSRRNIIIQLRIHSSTTNQFIYILLLRFHPTF